MKPKITVIIGPTASGKSDYAIQLAQKINAEIISADAYQIYKGLDIGTAKVTPSQQALIPHHLIDIKAPTEPYNVTEFIKQSKKIIKHIRSRQKPIIICGGTGLYIRSFLYNYQFPTQSTPPKKTTPPTHLENNNTKDLWKQLNDIDPETAKKIPYQNKRRIIRALAIFYETNQKPSQIKQQHNTIRSDVQLIGLRYPRTTLIQRINTRVDQMIKNGLVDEVTQLLHTGVHPTAQSLQAIGYKEIVDYLTHQNNTPINDHPLNDTIERIKIKTRQFSKRQMTWFKKFPHVQWIDQQ
tara:strand:- start:1466 stop:2353 length:888 start_codon:yes stop_codon:yes gene_type:complete